MYNDTGPNCPTVHPAPEEVGQTGALEQDRTVFVCMLMWLIQHVLLDSIVGCNFNDRNKCFF